jgi:glutathione synthase/RimK-type ligase-like ATP-grasp enzyme
MTTLIIADPWDIPARAASWGLQKAGEKSFVWYTHDFPQKHAVNLEVGNHLTNALESPEIELFCAYSHKPFRLGDCDSIWLRRWYQPAASKNLHPADHKLAQTESAVFIHSIIATMAERERFWVNNPTAKLRADRKPLQLLNAKEVGLTIPNTLFSNDPQRIRKFFQIHNGLVIYKLFTSASWSSLSDEKSYATYTSLLDEVLLSNDASLSSSPGIYQTMVPKQFELRITVIGQSVFAAKIDSQIEGNYLTDWRANQTTGRMFCPVYELPPAIEAKCLHLMSRLGLVFGCIDMIVTPDDQYVFLEVNEMGQFLFLEGDNPEFPLLDCFVKFMLSRNPKFKYSPTKPLYSFRSYCDSLDGDSLPAWEGDERHLAIPRAYHLVE